MASTAIKSLLERLGSIEYKPSKLVEVVQKKIKDAEELDKSTGADPRRKSAYEELKRMAGMRLAAGKLAFESTKTVLRYFFSYIEQYADQSGSDRELETKTKLLLKAILQHKVIQEEKSVLKSAFFSLSSRLFPGDAIASNRSVGLGTAPPSALFEWLGLFSTKEEVDLMPTSVREGIKAFIESIHDDVLLPGAGAGAGGAAGGGGEVKGSDIFQDYPRGAVRDAVKFPELKAGNLADVSVQGGLPRIELIGPAKRLYDSITIEGFLNTPRMRAIYGSVTGYATEQAVRDAEDELAPVRELIDTAKMLSRTAARVTLARGSRGARPGSSVLLLTNRGSSGSGSGGGGGRQRTLTSGNFPRTVAAARSMSAIAGNSRAREESGRRLGRGGRAAAATATALQEEEEKEEEEEEGMAAALAAAAEEEEDSLGAGGGGGGGGGGLPSRRGASGGGGPGSLASRFAGVGPLPPAPQGGRRTKNRRTKNKRKTKSKSKSKRNTRR